MIAATRAGRTTLEPLYTLVSSIRPAQIRRLDPADRARLMAALRALIGRVELGG